VLLLFLFLICSIDGGNNSFNIDRFRRINNNWFTLAQVEESDNKTSHRFLSDRIRSCINIRYDRTRSYGKSYEKSSSLTSDIKSYTKFRIWSNDMILQDLIRSYSKIFIHLFTITLYRMLLNQI
jgi:hypothetical protein